MHGTCMSDDMLHSLFLSQNIYIYTCVCYWNKSLIKNDSAVQINNVKSLPKLIFKEHEKEVENRHN